MYVEQEDGLKRNKISIRKNLTVFWRRKRKIKMKEWKVSSVSIEEAIGGKSITQTDVEVNCAAIVSCQEIIALCLL